LEKAKLGLLWKSEFVDIGAKSGGLLVGGEAVNLEENLPAGILPDIAESLITHQIFREKKS
jgi:hypothetical protein